MTRQIRLFEGSDDEVVTCNLCGHDFYTAAATVTRGPLMCPACRAEVAAYESEVEATCENCGGVFDASNEDAAKFHDDADCVDTASYHERERGDDDGVEYADPRDEQEDRRNR